MASVKHLFNKAVALHTQGQLQRAEKIYKKILKTQPDNPDVLHLLGLAAYQGGNFRSALNSMQRAIRLQPNVPDYYNDCGEAHRALQEPDQAIACYNKALALAPGFAGAHNNLGIVYKERGQLEEAVAHYEQALSLKPDYVEAHYNLAYVLQKLNRLQEASQHYERVLALKPDFAEAHNNLGNVLVDLGQMDAAITHLQQALALKPGHAMTHNNLAAALVYSGRTDEAISHYKQALTIEPDSAEIHNNLGDAYQTRSQLGDAIYHYTQALELNPDFAMAHNSLGTALAEEGRLEAAIKHYKQALAIKPDYAQAYNNLGNAFLDLGQLETAIEHFEQALALKPDYAEVYRHMAVLGKRIWDDKKTAAIEKLLNKADISDKDAMHLHFALGEIFDQNEIYDQAFEHYHQANELKRKTLTFDIKAHAAYIDRLLATYSRSFFAEQASLGSESELPVFIVGMPRSGTTLVEQIVSSHPQVYGAGELNNFLHIEQMIATQTGMSHSYPECMRFLEKSIADKISEQYLLQLYGYASDARYVTDKLPGNFLRIGLIKTLFPNAHVIHCKRNPLDVCLSIYCNYFTGGHDYAYNLNELGLYYREYERLMAHWIGIFASQIFEVLYEDLVLNQEIISRKMMDYLGLPWDPRCLEFHKNDRPVQTASNIQIRRPIYINSINRWKHYADYLEPLRRALGIDRDSSV